MIELTCFGPPAVRVDGGDPPPELLWRKNLALLIYLACSPRGRSRDHLIGVLWADKDEAKARHSLNEALRVLRKSLGPALETDATRARIVPGAVVMDLDHPNAGDGVFLEGFVVPEAPAFEQWMAAERQRQRDTALGTLATEAERALATGALTQATALAERALGLDARDEPAARALMRAYALAGARSRALSAYERLVEALRRDLDLAPDPDTQALAERIRAGRVVRGAPPADAPSETAPRPPLVGAGQVLLAQLVEHWRLAVAGTAQAVVIRGDPGTGKSRLLDECAARARLDGAVVTAVRVLDGDDEQSVWRALIRDGLTVPELGGAPAPALAGLAALDPDVAVRYPAARQASPLPPQEAVVTAVLAVAEQRPVCVLLDDAHHAPPAVLGALRAVVERGRRLPIAAVVAGQALPGTGALDALAEHVGPGRDMEGAVLQTKDLTAADILALVGDVLHGYAPQPAERLARRVLADSGGNPFLAVEVVQAVRAGLVLEDPDGRVWPAEHRTLDQTLPADLPGSVAAALRVRYRALTPAAQTALAALAVLGGEQPLDVLARGAELDAAVLTQALDELEWQRWTTGDVHGYRFVTRLAREMVLSDMLTGGHRRRIRERAGIQTKS